MSKNICVIMVLYNEYINNSITFKCLLDMANIDIIVCDNSSDEKYLLNQKLSKQYNITYMSMDGNKGLSKAYNKALDTIIDKGYEWVCLFDDDTFVPKDYFNKFIVEKENNKADIYLPIVEDGEKIISPGIMKKYLCCMAQDINLIKNEITGINSGMIISFDIFKDYRYDENYFLDYIDHAFIRDMRVKNRKIAVFNQRLKQNFAANSDDFNALKIRFKILKKDLKYFYKKLPFGFIYYKYVLSKRKLHLLFDNKKLSVLFW